MVVRIYFKCHLIRVSLVSSGIIIFEEIFHMIFAGLSNESNLRKYIFKIRCLKYIEIVEDVSNENTKNQNSWLLLIFLSVFHVFSPIVLSIQFNCTLKSCIQSEKLDFSWGLLLMLQPNSILSVHNLNGIHI